MAVGNGRQIVEKRVPAIAGIVPTGLAPAVPGQRLATRRAHERAWGPVRVAACFRARPVGVERGAVDGAQARRWRSSSPRARLTPSPALIAGLGLGALVRAAGRAVPRVVHVSSPPESA